ncbi:helix-turn-helix domain-containing protein [Mangrovimonas aestuarii]|uniref:helix-turn-helix domain-containing protein n=1 Tax=Mangrovimonas aestuarii TaxID=3018443 RepID=UPI0023786D9E|nr:helix-turn-helix domain-containing protein [Mangrovimonas aestuarii]
MAKFMLHTIELSDIKKVIEEVLEQKLKGVQTPTTQKKEYTLLSRKDTAKLLCVSLPTLHDWTKTGIIKAHRIGSRVLYKEYEILESLKQIQTLNKERRLPC